MNPRIEILKEKKLVGKRLKMSLNDNKTGELWKSFMPQKNEIPNKLSDDFISMQIYKPDYFSNFNPMNEFEKWATMEVADFENVPSNIETYVLPGGLYAVFDYKGLSSDTRIFQYLASKLRV